MLDRQRTFMTGSGRWVVSASLGLALLLAAAACAAMPAAKSVQDAGSPVSDDPVPPLTRDQQEELDYHTEVFRSPAASHRTRATAAGRLLEMNLRESIVVLQSALRGDQVPLMQAVIDAMSRQEESTIELLDAAVDALRTAPLEVTDPLTEVIVAYGDPALAELSILARDRAVPATERLPAVHALSAFSNRAGAETLLDLIDPQRREDQRLRQAAFEGLRRLSPADFGDDYQRWRRWWVQVRNRPVAPVTDESLDQLRDQLIQMRRENERLASQNVELLGELYRSIKEIDRQLARLQLDINDDLPVVREFALDRIDRLLRDSNPIPESLRDEVSRRLDDESAILRRKAATLLHELFELDDPRLGDTLAQRLVDETDTDAATRYLEILADRPCVEALDPVLTWLNQLSPNDAPAEALWRLLTALELDEAQLASAATVVAESWQVSDSPRIARLAALLIDEADLGEITTLLDDENLQIRSHVAEGLAARGVSQPLLDRAQDPAVYPWALQAISEVPAELVEFGRVVSLAPPVGMEETWQRTTLAFAQRLDSSLLLQVDDLLSSSGRATPQMRISNLQRGATANGDSVTPEYHVNVLIRLSGLLLEAELISEAFTLLENETAAELAEPKFTAALLAGRYAVAAVIHPEAIDWVNALAARVETNPAGAAGLRDEIARRFAESLSGELKTAFDLASAKIPPTTVDGSADGE